MSCPTKEKAFCMETYFVNNSCKLVQASFRRKFQCRHGPSKSRIFDWIRKSREYGTVKNQWNTQGKMCSSNWQLWTRYASLPPTPWRPFRAYFGKSMTFIRRDFTEWNFREWLYTDWSLKPAKYLKYTGTLRDLTKFLWVLVFCGSPCNRKHVEQ